MGVDFFNDWKNAGKKRSEKQMIGESGIDILRELFPKEWVIREYTVDYGIDLDVELFEKCDDEIYLTKGEHVLFQVKTTNNMEISDLKVYSDNNFEMNSGMDKNDFCSYKVVKYSLETDLLATVERMGSSVPVLLCLVDNVEREGYFVCLNDYIEKIIIPKKPNYYTQGSVTINIPVENKISSGKRIIEWYGKRAKLYSFFNMINSQNRELKYKSHYQLSETVEVFLKKICRLDIWSADMMKRYKDEIDYYLINHSTKIADRRIADAIESGMDVDEQIWEATYCEGDVSYRQAIITQEIHDLWNHLCYIADMYEDVYREAYLPTFYWDIDS